MKCWFGIAMLMWSVCCVAQKPFSKNLTTADGLAANTVYKTYQDSRGFIWFCTSQGLSRFNGSVFRNFTSADGLPNNEVFTVAEDQDGRIWVSCYNNQVCFIENEAVHPYHIRNKRHGSAAYARFVYSDEGQLLIDGGLLDFAQRRLRYYNGTDTSEFLCSFSVNGLTIYVEQQRISILKKGELQPVFGLPKATTLFSKLLLFSNQFLLQNTGGEKPVFYRFSVDSGRVFLKEKTTSIPLYTAALVWNDTTVLMDIADRGLCLFNPLNYRISSAERYIPKRKNCFLMNDRDGNLWLSGLRDGVYVVPRNKTFVYDAHGASGSDNVQSVWCLSDHSMVVGFDDNTILPIRRGAWLGQEIADLRVLKIRDWKGAFIAGGDKGLRLFEGSSETTLTTAAVKDFELFGTDSVVVATAADVRLGTMKGIQSKTGPHILYHERATAVCCDARGRIWIGTLQGVFIYERGTVTVFGGSPLLSSSHINGLQLAPNGTVWMSTNQHGVFCFVHDTVFHFSTANGLPDDFCKSIYVQNNQNIWVATEKGATRLFFPIPERFDTMVVTTVNAYSGLPDNNVNQILSDADTIYIATAKGFVKFVDEPHQPMSPPDICITGWRVNGHEQTLVSGVSLPYDSNNIVIFYSGISLRNISGLTYKFRLLPVQSEWTNSSEMNATLVSLPPGNYTFEVLAVDRNLRAAAEPARMQFSVRPPFWRQWWFLLLMAGGLAVIVWWLVQRRIRKIRQEEAEKTALNKQFATLELQAVAAQMNPHFIFNALTSIQNFYAQHDEATANKYLVAFSRLIRQILDNSRRSRIHLREEIALLENYLMLERMRFSDKFDFTIEVDEALQPHDISLPAMLLQPYIENAVNHGFRPLTDRKGLLKISFKKDVEAGRLICIIDDNGVGFWQNQKPKSDHVSAGMDITGRRIALLNKIHKTEIQQTISNKLPFESGTVVHISILIN